MRRRQPAWGTPAPRPSQPKARAVAICGRDKGRIEEAAGEIGANAIPLVADVSTTEGATAFVALAQEALGGLDILVTNGGGPPPGDFASTSLDAYAGAIELNLLSVVAMC